MATDTKAKPYGDVTYADPKNGKYPLDSEAHCRAAWSYINMPKNAAKYPLNGVTLSEVKDRIRAALKKYGADVSSDSSNGASRSEILRYYPLDDIRIVSRADGDGTGRVVEAYAAVFDEPAEIRDHEGHYEETIDRSAFNQVLASIQRSRGGLPSAIRVLYNHGQTMRGVEAPEFQKPLGKPLEVRPDGRGLLTRTEYGRSPLAEEILENIRSGAITAQSFVGGIMRSDPALKGPGDRYRARNGVLTRVRRLALGLREYGPVLYAAYPGAEFLGVRMGSPGPADDLDSPEDEEFPPANEDGDTGSAPEDATSARYHQHELYALRSREQREAIGLTW
jgi:phage head maturation protease